MSLYGPREPRLEMIPRNAIGWRFIGVTFCAAILIGLPGSGAAEQSSNFDPTPAAARRVSKPKADSANAAASPDLRATDQQGRPWSIDDALPRNSKAARTPAPEASSPLSKLGRVPLRSGAGTFGFESETKFKANELPDGRRIPALPQTKERTSPYVGFSLSVPTGDSPASPGTAGSFERR